MRDPVKIDEYYYQEELDKEEAERLADEQGGVDYEDLEVERAGIRVYPVC